MRKPLYRYPLRQAAANDEVKAWRESHRENIRCRDAMDISIRHHFDGMHLYDCAEELCDEFGADRVAWVLASTIQHADWDGRYRPNNREWAAKYAIPTDPEDKTSDFCLTTHPEIVNGFVNQYRQYFAEHGIHGNEAVIKDSHYGSYENKLLILNPSVLAEEYRDGDYQYFFASSGFDAILKSSGPLFTENFSSTVNTRILPVETFSALPMKNSFPNGQKKNSRRLLLPKKIRTKGWVKSNDCNNRKKR